MAMEQWVIWTLVGIGLVLFFIAATFLAGIKIVLEYEPFCFPFNIASKLLYYVSM